MDSRACVRAREWREPPRKPEAAHHVFGRLALSAIEASGTTTATVERALAAAAVRAMRGMAAGTLGMALALLGTLALRRALPIPPL